MSVSNPNASLAPDAGTAFDIAEVDVVDVVDAVEVVDVVDVVAGGVPLVARIFLAVAIAFNAKATVSRSLLVAVALAVAVVSRPTVAQPVAPSVRSRCLASLATVASLASLAPTMHFNFLAKRSLRARDVHDMCSSMDVELAAPGGTVPTVGSVYAVTCLLVLLG